MAPSLPVVDDEKSPHRHPRRRNPEGEISLAHLVNSSSSLSHNGIVGRRDQRLTSPHSSRTRSSPSSTSRRPRHSHQLRPASPAPFGAASPFIIISIVLSPIGSTQIFAFLVPGLTGASGSSVYASPFRCFPGSCRLADLPHRRVHRRLVPGRRPRSTTRLLFDFMKYVSQRHHVRGVPVFLVLLNFARRAVGRHDDPRAGDRDRRRHDLAAATLRPTSSGSYFSPFR